MNHEKTFEAINKLKEIEIELHRLKNALEMTNRALETKDEPVGWIDSKGYMICVKTDESCRPLYTTPQTKEWVGLTKEDADNIECWFREEIENDRFSVENLIAHIRAKLKERNT